jgi:hypothetical protein
MLPSRRHRRLMPVFGLVQTIEKDTVAEELATQPSGVLELRGWTRLSSAEVAELAQLRLDELDFAPAYVSGRCVPTSSSGSASVSARASFLRFLVPERSYERLCL